MRNLGGLGWNRDEAGMNLSLWAFSGIAQNQKYISEKSRVNHTDGFTVAEQSLHSPRAHPALPQGATGVSQSIGERSHEWDSCSGWTRRISRPRADPIQQAQWQSLNQQLFCHCSLVPFLPGRPKGERRREEGRGGKEEKVREGKRG